MTEQSLKRKALEGLKKARTEDGSDRLSTNVERCPFCGGQALSCSCLEGAKMFVPRTRQEEDEPMNADKLALSAGPTRQSRGPMIKGE